MLEALGRVVPGMVEETRQILEASTREYFSKLWSKIYLFVTRTLYWIKRIYLVMHGLHLVIPFIDHLLDMFAKGELIECLTRQMLSPLHSFDALQEKKRESGVWIWLSRLLFFLVLYLWRSTPTRKRLSCMTTIIKKEKKWVDDDHGVSNSLTHIPFCGGVEESQLIPWF